ncbi:MAG: hypothetical protein ACOCV7_05015 [Desulfonatronovibrionaceae bacterium]
MNNSEQKRPPGTEPEFFPPGSRVCFLCIQTRELEQEFRKAFDNLGYHVSASSEPETALGRIRVNQYQCAVIEYLKDYGPIFDEIARWNGHTRRQLNLIVLGRKAPSLHQQAAFLLGANFYINTADAGLVQELVPQCLDGFEIYYQPWQKAREDHHVH